MRPRGDGAAQQSGDKHEFGRMLTHRQSRQNCASGDADKCLDAVPDGIHDRNLVGQKLDGKKGAGDADDPGFSSGCKVAGSAR